LGVMPPARRRRDVSLEGCLKPTLSALDRACRGCRRPKG
jgi:hypothetical protein